MEDINPIGQVHNVPEFENKVLELTANWQSQTTDKKANLSQITLFLLGALDQLVYTIDGLLDKGIDKKATVLAGMERLYDFVQSSAFVPLWLKPFLSVIKSYVIYVLLSIFIDWMVSKYRQGQWKIKKESETKTIKKKFNRKKK